MESRDKAVDQKSSDPVETLTATKVDGRLSTSQMRDDVSVVCEQVVGSGIPVSAVRVTVSLEPTGLIDDYAAIYAEEAGRIAKFQGGSVALAKDELQQYFATLLWMRVNHVERSYPKGTEGYRAIAHGLAVPVLYHAFLGMIGIAMDRERGLEFHPAVTIDSKSLMSPDQLTDTSRKLKFLENKGLAIITTGIPKDGNGDEYVMGLVLLEGEIRGYRSGHPVHGFFASFVRAKWREDVLGATAFRIKYGSLVHYRSVLDTLLSRSFHS